MKTLKSDSLALRAEAVIALRHDPLWAPLLTHYDDYGAVDLPRMLAQVRSLTSSIKQFLIAGSTGDGWEISDAMLRSLVDLAQAGDIRLLFGALRGSTEAVIRSAMAIETALATAEGNATIVGLTVCPPVNAEASQELILDHYQRILTATRLPIALYQLPQVTGCEIHPDTMLSLIENPRVLMFKDTSGGDKIASAGAAEVLACLRGAEGDYSTAQVPRGKYNGWLLSSGNAVPELLRAMATLLKEGRIVAADAVSERIDRIVVQLFAAARPLPFGNAFSNANRAADHIRAYGKDWREAPVARTVSGAALPTDLLDTTFALFETEGLVPATGYLA
jgi:dihydrodipicolinate synthase/N-acetylneuraminate lyase